jgi:acyl dehydratase
MILSFVAYRRCARNGTGRLRSRLFLANLTVHVDDEEDTPMKLHFEDFKVGPFGTFGPRHVTREELIAFAKEYDPQPMHLDEEAAKHSMLKGLAGSGWHMCALTMRMMADGYILRSACLGAPGVDEVRWTAPLRAGDDLTLKVEVLSVRESGSRPTIGFVTMKHELLNAAGTSLMTMQCPIMMIRRHAAETAEAR